MLRRAEWYYANWSWVTFYTVIVYGVWLQNTSIDFKRLPFNSFESSFVSYKGSMR